MRSASSVFERFLLGIEKILAVALLAAIGLNFANVIGRYALGRTMLGADELQTYAMVWIAFLGAGLVAWRGEHLRMDVLSNLYPAPLRRAVGLVESLVTLLVVGFTLVQSVRYTETMWQFGERSPTAGLPMWIAHSGLAVGLAFILIAGVRRFRSKA